MENKVENFINKTLKKENDFLFNIAKDKYRKYPNETLRQVLIRTIVEHFENKYPSLMSEFDSEIKKRKELAKNKYHSSTDIDIRKIAALPDGLSTRINKVFIDKNWPRFLSDEAQKEFKELDWFIKEFPRFMIPDEY